MKRVFLLPLLLLAGCRTRPPGAPFDVAENASMERDQRMVRDSYLAASTSDADPKRRAQAILRAARLDWYVFHDPAAARALLARLSALPEASAALAERSRMETELTRDFDAARKFAADARTAAATHVDRDEALTREAAATVEEERLALLAGKCPGQRPRLAEASAGLSAAIGGSGPSLERSRLLLDAALLAGDDETALKAWRWYYGELPSLVPDRIDDRRTAGLALARAKLFDEAELVLRNPCSPVATDGEAGDVLAYAASLRRIRALAGEHHRQVASGAGSAKRFRKALEAEASTLWNALSHPAGSPAFSPAAMKEDLERRFGAVISLGETEGIYNLLYGHRVADESKKVEQYGKSATLRFVQLDGMISGGYATWVSHGQHGTGGWIGDGVVYQIRPMYADDPLRTWRRLTDTESSERAAVEIREESARDEERAKKRSVVALRGLELRLDRQYAEGVRKRLEEKGLSGDGLRDEFLRTIRLDTLASSIWAHEGRHAIDKALGIDDSTELEYRAKHSEVAFAPGPKGALGSILSPIGGPGAHGKANERVLTEVVGWMDAHASEIQELDRNAPRLPQLDRLTDEQLRSAFRAHDPLARSSNPPGSAIDAGRSL